MPNLKPGQAVDLLRKCSVTHVCAGCPLEGMHKCDEELMKMAAEVIEELSAAASEAEATLRELNELRNTAFGWIDPDVQPPPDGIVCLMTDGRCVDSGIYESADESFDADHAFIDPCNVVGWRPWPEVQ